MQRDKEIAVLLNSELLMDGRGGDSASQLNQRVDHRIPDKADAVFLNPLALQVFRRLHAVDEAPLGELIDEQAVDLLGHRAIETSEPGFEMRNRNL